MSLRTDLQAAKAKIAVLEQQLAAAQAEIAKLTESLAGVPGGYLGGY